LHICLVFLPENILVMLRPELSIIIGAFIAGLILGNLPYYVEIISRVTSLKDFFATMFFVSLGMGLVWINSLFIPVLILVLVIIFLKPYVTLILGGYFGYRRRPTFLTSISLTQSSEFALIIAAQGLFLGHISQEVFTIAILVAVITMSISTYFINYEEKIYNRVKRSISWVDKLAGNTSRVEYIPKSTKKVILCGYNRMGYVFLQTLKEMKKQLLVIDFNPETVKYLVKRKIPCMYGDVGESETLDRLDLKHAEMIISTVNGLSENMNILKKAKSEGSKAKLFLTAIEIEDALALYEAGADYVILPHLLGGLHASGLIRDFDENINKMIKTRLEHIKELKQRNHRERQ